MDRDLGGGFELDDAKERIDLPEVHRFRSMTTVGVVGLGRMGSRVAHRLLGAGHDVVVWNRSPERMAPLAERGAHPAATPADAAARATVLITLLSDSAALRSVTEGRGGIAAGTDASSTVIEMSTVGPAGVEFLASALPADAGLLDAPVLGSLGEAEAGSLTILVGGPAALLERVRPVLSTLGTPLHVGPLGAGAAAKLVANATLFGTLATLGEAVALARSLDLSDDATHQVLAATPVAAQARRRRPAMETGEYPPRFALSLARKDADLIACAAAAAGADVRVAAAARAWLADAESAGLGDRDYTAVLEAILRSGGDGDRRRATGREPPSRRFDYDGLIVDLDGVVWLGGEPIKGAAHAITTLRARGTRVLFVTNDPQSSRGEHAGRLVALGIPATAADVMTAAAVTARHLRAQRHLAGCGVLVVGSRALRDEIAQAGFRLVPAAEARRAEVVVVGGHDRFDFEELRAATTAVRNGAALYATGRDAVYPTRDGPRPATGAILAAVEVAAGVTATVIGKPDPFMFEVARDALAGCRHVAVIGDHLISDIVGAKRAGLDAILVLTGTTTRDDLEQAATQPDLVLPSLAALPGAVPEPGDP
jgi:HAD superfamily hydrolase (TIGR01450 family)